MDSTKMMDAYNTWPRLMKNMAAVEATPISMKATRNFFFAAR